MENKVFNRVGNAKVPRSQFNLSHEVKFTADMGLLYPVMCEEMTPGDIFEIGAEDIVRFQPMVSPMLHTVKIYQHTYFIPYRLMFDDWEEFITGGEDGESDITLPRWTPDGTNESALGSLWDYFGFPLNLPINGALPLDFPKRAYNMVYNEYYRDQNLIDEIDITTSFAIQRRAWAKDYLTSALPWQQRGTAPALPISGTTSAIWDSATIATGSPPQAIGVSTGVSNYMFGGSAQSQTNLKNWLDSNTVDLSTASTFDINDLRTAIQVQRWLERNARCGSRYIEHLKAHHGVSPRDDRLQRPEYIGGIQSDVLVSEVLQTSETTVDSPQGNLGGHGISASSNYTGRYKALEHGLCITIMSIMPKANYHQGIEKQWLREDKFDFYTPEFSHLGEQAVTQAELYATGIAVDDAKVFGFQGRYNEMRSKQNRVCGLMRPGQALDYWTLCRTFGSAPLLNQEFIECDPSKRAFAVQDEPIMVVQHANIIKANRPLPYMAEPGLMDHI